MSTAAQDTPQVFHYIVFRAEKEGVPFDLQELTFKNLLAAGCRNFFGAKTNELGDVLEDVNNPTVLDEFKSLQ